jgi:hypothetical protein
MVCVVALAALFGVILGQFFKVPILFLANGFSILLVLPAFAYLDDRPSGIAVKIMLLTPSISVGFVLGQTLFHIPYLFHRRRTLRKTRPSP